MTAQQRVRLETRLAPPAPSPASGHARFEQRPDRRRFSVEAEGLRGVTAVIVQINGRPFGRIAVVGGRAEVELDSRRGHAVPVLRPGDLVTVHDGGRGTLLLRGALRGG